MVDSKIKENAGKILFLGIFVVAGLIAMRINFSQLVGSNSQFFTFFQFFAPIAGSFLGGLLGAGIVLITQLVDFLFVGKETTLVNLGRLLPLVLAAWYFGTNDKQKYAIAIPLVAIALFWMHPVGMQVWYFPLLFWTIPILAKLFFAENLLAKSLGATLTAHSVGGVVWIYTNSTTAAYWSGLIPIVAYERFLFAIGIAVSFVALNALFSRVKVPEFVNVNYRMPFATPKPVQLKLKN